MMEGSMPPTFQPNSPDAAGIISWAHIGDLHMTLAGEQNDLDLQAIVADLNAVFGSSLSFVFLPGDVADGGAAAEYAVVREALDRLRLPWCSIVGDHDVHLKSFANFTRFMSTETHFAFTVGAIRFFGLNAFDRPDPGSFAVLPEQLAWLEDGLKSMDDGMIAVLFLHCYPTELKQGGDELTGLIARYPVRLVEMGHTHYNEVANDGRVLYAATRSTGQIEEGPVGFSVTNLDGTAVSWKFLDLGSLPNLIITSPADVRLLTDTSEQRGGRQSALRVRAKVWSKSPVRKVSGRLGDKAFPLTQVQGSQVWEGYASVSGLNVGVHDLSITMTDTEGGHATDTIRTALGDGAYQPPERCVRDLENALQAWPEHGLLGTQLGPNKNGQKW